LIARRSASMAWLLAAATVAPACSSFLTSDAPPEPVYWLEPLEVPPSVSSAGAPSVSVRVTAAPGLDANRLLLRGPGATLAPYAGARWADRIPDVLSVLLRTVLEDSGQFGRVSSSTSGIRADWLLDLDVRSFYAVAAADAAPPSIVVEIRGHLECEGNALPIRIESRASVAAHTLTSIVQGFQSAVDDSARALIEQTTRRC
jgi:ABC-type uncharacterized transport system auxiliary subunit